MNIQLSKRVDLLDTLHCTVLVDIEDNVYNIAIMHDEPNSHRNTVYPIKGEQATDVEFLADTFAFEMVCVFKAIVELRAKATVLKQAI